MKQFDSNVNYRINFSAIFQSLRMKIEVTSSDKDTDTASECTDYSDTDTADEY